MSNRHLPAGQTIPLAQGATGSGMSPVIIDMPNGPPPVVGPMPGHHGHPGPRRRGPPHAHAGPPPHHQQYAPQYYQQHMHPHMNPGYMPYGAPQQYYGMPLHYPNAGMPAQPYSYQNYPRSPPVHHSYAPPHLVNGPPSYSRQQPQSPALSTPYHPPLPGAVPIPPHTPSSTHSSHMALPQTPPTPQTTAHPLPQEPSPVPTPPKKPFRAPLPWLSRPDVEFPSRSSKVKTRRRPLLSGNAVSLPVEQQAGALEQNDGSAQVIDAQTVASTRPRTPSSLEQQDFKPSSVPSTTPHSVQRSRAGTATSTTPTKSVSGSASTPRIAAPPAVPTLPKHLSKPQQADKTPADAVQNHTETAGLPNGKQEPDVAEAADAQSENTEEASQPPPKVAPTSWANLFARNAAATRIAGQHGSAMDKMTVNANGGTATSSASLPLPANANAGNVADAIRAYHVGYLDKVSFIEPRGLINTGNMCYMNSVLQVLMFCIPFYDFLQQVSNRAAHSFKSDTPLIDAMIMFMHEFKVLKSGSSPAQLRQHLKAEDLEKYGEPFTPEFVYEAIRQLPRFASMRRGHQQDAEEFLGFLLQGLDDECTHVVGTSLTNVAEAAASEKGAGDGQVDPSGDWLEVGRKQKAAVTRSSGSNISTPITKIFGGLLRSEFRVPGLKDSITTERYQPLQLDIGSPDVRNVVDALRGLTRPERLQGDFNSPRGKDVVATKQVFIETLPPVLILHLKRFQFDAEGHGTIKIWKKVDYPLELEIPREALSRQKRQTISESTMPRYKLISVVYHHGKNASGGHYTVDVRRQDEQDWLRLDDTVLRRVRSDDVAETGSEEESRSQQKESVPVGASGNRFGAVGDEDTGDDDEEGWNQVTASAGDKKRWSNVVNGAGNGTPKGKQYKESVKDNKVAYLLFYQKI